MQFSKFFKTVTGAGLLAASAVASALPVTYTFTGTASGTFGSTAATPFTNQLLTVRVTGDTVNVNTLQFGAGTPSISTGLTNTLTLGALLNTSITQPGLSVFNNQANRVVGLSVTQQADLFSLNDIPTLATYGLVTNFGPVTDATPFFSQWVGVALATNGAMTLTNLTNATFTAAVVPEPASVALLLLGLGAVGVAVRRRVTA